MLPAHALLIWIMIILQKFKTNSIFPSFIFPYNYRKLMVKLIEIFKFWVKVQVLGTSFNDYVSEYNKLWTRVLNHLLSTCFYLCLPTLCHHHGDIKSLSFKSKLLFLGVFFFLSEDRQKKPSRFFLLSEKRCSEHYFWGSCKDFIHGEA